MLNKITPELTLVLLIVFLVLVSLCIKEKPRCEKQTVTTISTHKELINNFATNQSIHLIKTNNEKFNNF